MTAFVASNGLDNYFDAYTGGSVVATLDTYTISNKSRLVVRTDTYSCPNHSVAFGSLDSVSFGGIGGTLHFDPTYVRVIAYTGGSGNSPAYGTTISQGGVSGVFLGCWTTWQSDPIVAGAAIGSTGFIKIGGKTGGDFAAGALTGITATCSGVDVQGWIEVRGADTATITVPRIGKVTSTEAWFELGTTSGVSGQIIPCPTTQSFAGTFAGCQIETSAGSGVYEWYVGVGSLVAVSTTRTDASCKFIWSTTSGIRIGNDGTNNVGYLPPVGCKVRIPAILWTTCTRTTAGSGARVIPNATLATRQEFVSTGAGYFDLKGIVSQWYMSFNQAFYVKCERCAFNDLIILNEIASPITMTDCIVSPTQAQVNVALQMNSCFSGGTITDSRFWRFSLGISGVYCASVNYVNNFNFTLCHFGTLTLRTVSNGGTLGLTQCVNTVLDDCTTIGSQIAIFQASQNTIINNLRFYDHTHTTTTTSTNGVYAISIGSGTVSTTVNGISFPIINVACYNYILLVTNAYNTIMRNIGTFASPLALNSAVTAGVVGGGGNCQNIKIQRVYVTGTRVGFRGFQNSDYGIIIENCSGDYADTDAMAACNTIERSIGNTGSTSGQQAVYGYHWVTRFTSATAGFTEILCNEPTAATSAQCTITGGTPLFNSNGSVLLTVVGDQVTWELPYFAKGYTAFTNVAPSIIGTNVTFSSNARWGNHDLHFQVDNGTGYGGTWLNLNAATLTAQTFNSTTGFKIKVRATCAVAASSNALTNMRISMTTTSTVQGTSLYPLSVNSLTLNGLTPGSEVRVYSGIDPATSIEIGSVESSGTSFTFTHELAGLSGYYQIIAESKVPIFQTLTFPSIDSSITISQRPDRTFLNE